MARKLDFFSQDSKRNPFPVLQALRDRGAVSQHRFPIVGKVHLAVSWASCSDFLKSGDRFAADGRNAGKSSALGIWWAPRFVRTLAHNMLALDDPDHRRLRKLVEAHFRRVNIEAMRPAITLMARELLDDMDMRGRVDLVRGFARELPLRVICNMLGLPDALRARTQNCMGRFAEVGGLISAARVFPDMGALMDLLREEFARQRNEPGPGLLGQLVQAQSDGDRLTEDELLATVFLLFIAGHETTTHLISTSVLDLLQNPDQFQMLRGSPGLLANAVEELHRHNSPVQVTKPRMAREDMDFHGARLRRGDRVFGILASANADPVRFDRPERLDFNRQDARHVGYGGGMHLCLGMHLARIELEIALEILMERWPRLSLAKPANELRWLSRPGMRGLAELPLVTG